MTVSKLEDCEAHKNAFELIGRTTGHQLIKHFIDRALTLFLSWQAQCLTVFRWCARTSRTCRTGWNTWQGRPNTMLLRPPATNHSLFPATRSGAHDHMQTCIFLLMYTPCGVVLQSEYAGFTLSAIRKINLLQALSYIVSSNHLMDCSSVWSVSLEWL